MKKPIILVTNDDSIYAKGIRCLVEVAKEFGDVYVVAPATPQSGMGHAITIHDPIYLTQTNTFDVPSFICSGTPVDCVKLGIVEVLGGRKPDLLLSGINHGANYASNVLYSGTMSAAVEGAIEGIPSIGFSLCAFEADANFEPSQHIIREVFQLIEQKPIPNGICLNVNIPDVPFVRGVKFCKQADTNWVNGFEKRMDPMGRSYFWLTGEFKTETPVEDTDSYWIKENYATVVPTQYDMTAHDVLKNHFNFNNEN